MSYSSLRANKPGIRRDLAAVLVALALMTASPVAAAEPYDRDATNPLRVVSYFLHPVGTVLEWTVFRPLHVVGSLVAPDPAKHKTDRSGCERERPARNCVASRD